MDKIIIFLLLVFSSLSFGQYKYQYHKIDTILLKKYENLNKESFYSLSEPKELEFYIKESNKKFKLLFTFTYWCKPCKEKHPEILSLSKDYSSTLDVLYLTDLYNNKGYLSTEIYLKNIGNNNPIFSLNENENLKNEKGKYNYEIKNAVGKNIKTDRYTYFIHQLIPSHKDYGYSLVVLYDENNTVLYASTYNETSAEVIKKIKNIIK